MRAYYTSPEYPNEATSDGEAAVMICRDDDGRWHPSSESGSACGSFTGAGPGDTTSPGPAPCLR